MGQINIRKGEMCMNATTSLRNRCEIKDIAEVLGHRRVVTTEKYYISSTEKDKLQNLLKKV